MPPSLPWAGGIPATRLTPSADCLTQPSGSGTNTRPAIHSRPNRRAIVTNYSFYLCLLTILLALRVAGQLVVVLRAPRWLPPMEQWQSGLLPYPVLLLGQAIVLTLMIWICVNVTRGAGLFFEPRWPRGGKFLVVFSYVYFGAMILRYIIWMRRRPDQRWVGGTIPIIFHSVMAAFLYTFGRYHVIGR